jgi:hypothetical protein
MSALFTPTNIGYWFHAMITRNLDFYCYAVNSNKPLYVAAAVQLAFGACYPDIDDLEETLAYCIAPFIRDLDVRQ